MDWLKKNQEKVLLAGALLLLIVVAAALVFKIRNISTSLHLPESGNRSLASIDPGLCNETISKLESPPRWVNPNAVALFPPVIVETNLPAAQAKVPLFALESVVRKPFVLRFLDYNRTGKNNFQVNFLAEDQKTVLRSFFVEKVSVEIADRFGKTGYFVTKYEHKTRRVDRRGVMLTEDCSELTVQHKGEDPIVLVLGVPGTHPKPYARILWRDNPEPFEKPVGETFTAGRSTYKVIDIKDREVIIENVRSGKKLTVRPAAAEVKSSAEKQP
ncbi:MAG: hypothetical protein FJ395_14200 [Verrucomicrobia bacterium]|nr:hypothetical protein [Verrucomicrobiota bacterium]